VLALNDFSFEFAGRYLYRKASWHIKPNEKIGLVGLNGTGKSTLLRLISGEYELREGSFSKSNNLRIGFLNQDLLSVEFNESVRDIVMSGREDLVEIDKEVTRLLKEIETEYDDRRLNRLSELQEQFGNLGGYDWQSQGDKILEGLGFPTEWLDKPLKQFSGGWRMRAILGKLLLMSPDLLLLDEPTNHLDLPTIEWLENYLSEYQGTYIIVSHDRFFLDKTVNRIAEVAHNQIFHYKGNFSDFLEQKEERDELLQRQFANQQDFIRQQMAFISRFRYKASKAAAVQSRVKQLQKIDRIELKDRETRDFDIKFNIRVKPGKIVTEIKEISKSFGDLKILDHASGTVLRGDKIALIGANGKGKSTLLRMIHGSESYDGVIEPGWNVETAFFAQHQLESLDLKKDLLNEIGTVSAEYTEKELRTVLGCFLFSGEEVFKKVKVLSGGEKSRLALAKTLITQSNFLLLDEPTNHLDMFSTSVLAESLENYDGSVLFVSHDRTFISRVANKIWWIENGKLKEYPGTYDEFNEWMEKRPVVDKTIPMNSSKGSNTPHSNNNSESKPSTVSNVNSTGDSSSKMNSTTADENSTSTGKNSTATGGSSPSSNGTKGQEMSKNQLKKLEQTMESLESEISLIKQQCGKIEEQLGSPEIASNSEKLVGLTQEHRDLTVRMGELQIELDELMETWIANQ
jgi:ATP-binding cassette subfamily F protein 3